MKKTAFVSSAAACAVTALLSGCGLADVGATTAAQGESAVEQAKNAKKTEARVQQRIDDAQKAEKAARDAAEAQSE